jgi:PAS domain S-box-containing protein
MDMVEKHISHLQHLQDGVAELSNLDFSNEILDLVFNKLQEGIIIANTKGDFVFFNEAAENILGIGLLEIPADEWSRAYGCFYPDKKTVMPPDNIPLFRSVMHKEICSLTLFIRNSSKPEGVFLDVYSSPLYTDSGVFIGGVAFFRDITKDVNAEIKLKESEEKFKSLFVGIPIPTYVWQKINDKYILVDYNYYAELITKGNIANLRYKTLEEIFPDKPEVHIDFEKCYSLRKAQVRELKWKMQTTNEIKDFYVTYAFVDPDLILVHTQDITKRKDYERELQKLSNAIEQTEDAIIITDIVGKIEYVNSAFEKTYGYKSEEVIGNNPSILKSGYHDEDFYRELWSTISNKKTFKATVQNRKKNGTTYWVQQTISPIIDEEGNIINFVAVNKDISELKKRLEKEMELLKTDNLLLNILPAPIAKRLKNGESNIADYVEDVAVIFIDIVGFTHLTSILKPHTLVAELNNIFTIFDKLSQQFGIEKIKTLGDCYMAAAGVPLQVQNSALSIALMALEVQRIMDGYKTTDGFEIKFRIGIDCGPVVAGVIGEKKFIYDLWGDSVNSASRMKDVCEIGQIHCTERFMHRILDTNHGSDLPAFVFSEKIITDIKGIGPVPTYYILRK